MQITMLSPIKPVILFLALALMAFAACAKKPSPAPKTLAEYDATGKKGDGLECFKQIYAVDYGFRDVAARVEGAY